MIFRGVFIAVSAVLLLAGCGKKPAQLQPLAAPLGVDPAYYPYPKIQAAPPIPADAVVSHDTETTVPSSQP